MAFRIFLIFSLFLASCAQVGTITGGNKDEIAPQLISTNLQNGQLNFQETEVRLRFDEFVQLNKPETNIQLIPADVKMTYLVKGKEVKIQFSEPLKSNTSYVLALRNAIKDYSEGNDSIMNFAFSTGSKLDSMSLCFHAKRYFTKANVPNLIIGLYDSLSSKTPRYTGQTVANGCFCFQYLGEKSYFVKAFEDKNKNALADINEEQAFEFQAQTTKHKADTTTLFVAPIVKQIRKFEAAFPYAGLLAVNRLADSVVVNGVGREQFQFENLKEDSCVICLPTSLLSTKNLSIKTPSDSTSILYLSGKTKAIDRAELSPNFKDKQLVLSWNQCLQSVDFQKISWLNLIDSSKLTVTGSFNAHFLTLDFPLKAGDYELSIPSDAILTNSGNSVKLKEKMKIPLDKELGELQLFNSENLENLRVDVLQGAKLMRSVSVQKEALLTHLSPGEYQIISYQDLNLNGKWDGWDLEKSQVPEPLLGGIESVKIRANWTIEKKIGSASKN